MKTESMVSESLGIRTGYCANVFEDGDVTFYENMILSGDAIILGSLSVEGIIFVKGDLYTEENLDAFAFDRFADFYSLYVDGDLYVGKNINLISNIEVTGSIICNGNISAAGRIVADNISIYGSIQAEELVANHIQVKDKISILGIECCQDVSDNEYDEDYEDEF